MTAGASGAQSAAPARRPQHRRELLDHVPQELIYLNFLEPGHWATVRGSSRSATPAGDLTGMTLKLGHLRSRLIFLAAILIPGRGEGGDWQVRGVMVRVGPHPIFGGIPRRLGGHAGQQERRAFEAATVVSLGPVVVIAALVDWIARTRHRHPAIERTHSELKAWLDDARAAQFA